MLPRSFVKMKEVTNLNGDKEWVADQVLVNGEAKDQIENYPRTITICSQKLKKQKLLHIRSLARLSRCEKGVVDEEL